MQMLSASDMKHVQSLIVPLLPAWLIHLSSLLIYIPAAPGVPGLSPAPSLPPDVCVGPRVCVSHSRRRIPHRIILSDLSGNNGPNGSFKSSTWSFTPPGCLFHLNPVIVDLTNSIA